MSKGLFPVLLVALAAAAAAVVAASLLVVPAPTPESPLAAAWSSYHAVGKNGLGSPSKAEAERMYAVLGPASRTPALAAFGLHKDGWAAREKWKSKKAMQKTIRH